MQKKAMANMLALLEFLEVVVCRTGVSAFLRASEVAVRLDKLRVL